MQLAGKGGMSLATPAVGGLRCNVGVQGGVALNTHHTKTVSLSLSVPLSYKVQRRVCINVEHLTNTNHALAVEATIKARIRWVKAASQCVDAKNGVCDDKEIKGATHLDTHPHPRTSRRGTPPPTWLRPGESTTHGVGSRVSVWK